MVQPRPLLRDSTAQLLQTIPDTSNINAFGSLYCIRKQVRMHNEPTSNVWDFGGLLFNQLSTDFHSSMVNLMSYHPRILKIGKDAH